MLKKGDRKAENTILRGCTTKIMRENRFFGPENIVAVEKITVYASER